jgi:hypothetical protein
MASKPCITAFMPEPHTLLIVLQPTDSGTPPPKDAWRAGACPSAADKTQPISTSEIDSGFMFAAATAARIALAPSTGDATPAKTPLNEPIAVRFALSTTTSFIAELLSFVDQLSGKHMSLFKNLVRGWPKHQALRVMTPRSINET